MKSPKRPGNCLNLSGVTDVSPGGDSSVFGTGTSRPAERPGRGTGSKDAARGPSGEQWAEPRPLAPSGSGYQRNSTIHPFAHSFHGFFSEKQKTQVFFFFFFLGAGQRVRLCTGLQEPAGTPAQLQTEKQRGVMGPGPGENQHCLAWRPPPGRPVPFPHTTQGQCLQTALEKCSRWESGGLFHWRRRLITI